jgi:hypothetical protein
MQFVSADKAIHRFPRGRVPDDLVTASVESDCSLRPVTEMVGGIGAMPK